MYGCELPHRHKILWLFCFVLAVELSQPIGLQPTRHHEEMMEIIWIEVMNPITD